MDISQRVESISSYKHISKVVERTKSIMDKVRSGEFSPIFTSSKKEREKIGGYFPSDQVVIAARTGTGKSAKVVSDLEDFCNHEINPKYFGKLVILFDSWEMADFRNILRMISRKAEVEVKELLDYSQRLQEERYQRFKEIADTFKGLPVFISTRPQSVKEWVETKKQVQGLFPDKYIMNVFDHTRLVIKETESKEEELITNLMIKGIDLKNNFNMINIFLSQMNRNIETAVGREKMGTHTPVASDIFGSDGVFQCADIVLALHRPGMYKIEKFEGIPTGYDPSNPDKNDDLLVECVLKQRDGWTGNLLMKHNLAHNKIWDLDINQTDLTQIGW